MKNQRFFFLDCLRPSGKSSKDSPPFSFPLFFTNVHYSAFDPLLRPSPSRNNRTFFPPALFFPCPQIPRATPVYYNPLFIENEVHFFLRGERPLFLFFICSPFCVMFYNFHRVLPPLPSQASTAKASLFFLHDQTEDAVPFILLIFPLQIAEHILHFLLPPLSGLSQEA